MTCHYLQISIKEVVVRNHEVAGGKYKKYDINQVRYFPIDVEEKSENGNSRYNTK